jgi:hypothetical protein
MADILFLVGFWVGATVAVLFVIDAVFSDYLHETVSTVLDMAANILVGMAVIQFVLATACYIFGI